MTADDLQTDRQPFRREAARHRDRRVADDRDVVARLHPVDVGLHRDAVDLGDVRLVDVERRHLHRRQHEELVALHELPHAVIELGALRLRPRDLGRASAARRDRSPRGSCPSPDRDAPAMRGATPVRNASARSGLEDRVEVGEVRLRLLDDAAERFEDARAARSPLSRTRRSTGTPPRSVHQAMRTPLKSRSSGAANSAAGLVDARSAIARSGPAIALSSSATSATLRAIGPSTLSVRPRGRGRPHRHAARRRPQADDAAEAGGIAERAAHVAAVGDRQHAARERDRRAAAAAAAGLGQVVRIQRRAEHRVERLRSGAELRRVRLADDDRAGAAARRSTSSESSAGHEVLEDRRPERRADAFGRLQILVRDRQAVQRTDGVAVGELLVGRRARAPSPDRRPASRSR